MRTITGLEELKAAEGETLGTSDWHEVTQKDVDTFADVTGDHQWIHVDVERAKETPFGGTIAHGYLHAQPRPVPQQPGLQARGLRLRAQLRPQQGPLPGAGADPVARSARAPKVKEVDRHPGRRPDRLRGHLRARGRREAGLRRRDASSASTRARAVHRRARRRRRRRRGRCRRRSPRSGSAPRRDASRRPTVVQRPSRAHLTTPRDRRGGPITVPRSTPTARRAATAGERARRRSSRRPTESASRRGRGRRLLAADRREVRPRVEQAEPRAQRRAVDRRRARASRRPRRP